MNRIALQRVLRHGLSRTFSRLEPTVEWERRACSTRWRRIFESESSGNAVAFCNISFSSPALMRFGVALLKYPSPSGEIEITSNPTPDGGPRVLMAGPDRDSREFAAELIQIPRGKSVRRGGDTHILGMHVSEPVNVDCVAGNARVRGAQRVGDMDFVPAGVSGSWEDDAECRILRLTLRPSLLAHVALDLERDPAKLELSPRLHFRDPRTEAILWAIKTDLAAPVPADRLFADHLAHALAVRLVELASGPLETFDEIRSSRLSRRQLAVLIDFIDANLDKKLSLSMLASELGVSVTRLKILFRGSTGVSVHQYVIRRRVEYASTLIATTTVPASEIALAAGFSHQTHMAAAMRKLLGLTPKQIERPSPRVWSSTKSPKR